MNNCVFIGRLGKDPELRFMQNGKAVCNFSVAVSGRKKVGDQWEDDTLWLRVNTFDKLAERCNEYLAKGKQVAINGKLQVRSYEKDGAQKQSVEINANDVQFLTPKAEGQPSQSESKPRESQQKTTATSKPQEEFIDDDLPF